MKTQVLTQVLHLSLFFLPFLRFHACIERLLYTRHCIIP